MPILSWIIFSMPQALRTMTVFSLPLCTADRNFRRGLLVFVGGLADLHKRGQRDVILVLATLIEQLNLTSIAVGAQQLVLDLVHERHFDVVTSGNVVDLAVSLCSLNGPR